MQFSFHETTFVKVTFPYNNAFDFNEDTIMFIFTIQIKKEDICKTITQAKILNNNQADEMRD